MTYSPTGNTGRSCYWRNIQSRSELDPKTIGSESLRGRFFDPKIPGNVDSVDLREISFADFNGPRTWRLNLHSWRFLDFWLHSPQSSAEHVVDLVEILTKYDDEVWRSGELRQSIEFVESDISVAARAAGLAFALCVDNELSISTADQRRTMEKMLQEHLLYAENDANCVSSNHGVFNDMYLILVRANSPEFLPADRFQSLMFRLRDTYLNRQVSREGIHLEHTPSYAQLWLRLGDHIVRLIQDTGVEDEGLSEDLIAMYRRVYANMYWFTKPDGHLVAFGDQTRQYAPRDYQLLERPPGAQATKLFRESGYAFYKSDGDYIALNAAYHASKADRSGFYASTHKHMDDLSLVWSINGEELLVDPGLRSYEYSPERRYAVSKQGHNTVVVTEKEEMGRRMLETLERTWPYGSGGRSAIQYPNGTVHLSGIYPVWRQDGIYHKRDLIYEPGECLHVIDLFLRAKGGRTEWNYHFAPNVSVTQEGSTYRFKADSFSGGVGRSANTDPLSTSEEIHRGSFDPIRGWVFEGDGPKPTSTLSFIEYIPSGRSYRGTSFCADSDRSIEHIEGNGKEVRASNGRGERLPLVQDIQTDDFSLGQ